MEVCPTVNDVVLLGDVSDGTHCPAGSASTGGPGSYAALATLSGSAPSGVRVEVNGHPGVRLTAAAGSGAERVAYPDLGVVVSVAGPRAAAIASSVGWSAQHLALHPAGLVAAPAGWRTVTYAGLEMRVPPSWPVSQVGGQRTDPGVCGPPEFHHRQVFEGAGQAAPSCPPTIPTVTAGVDGVWIRGYQSRTSHIIPPAGAVTLRNTGLQVMELPQPSGYTQPVLRLLVLPSGAPPPSGASPPDVVSLGGMSAVSIDIGLGPDPATASRILASLSTVPRLPIQTTPMTVTPGPTSTTTPPTTTPPTTTPPTTTPPTTVTPSVPAATVAAARASLPAFVDTEAAGYATAARKAGQTWNGSLHSPAVVDDGTVIAVAAFSYAPAGHQVQVLGYSHGHWASTAALAAPQNPVVNSYWLATDPGASISAADPTGDGRPDFLIPEQAADNVPGAVLSQDGPTGRWRYIPFTGPFPTSDTIGRDPRFTANTLVSTYDNCNPDCAQGTDYTMTWTYEPGPGVFWAPDPPGWTPPAGATNHS